MTGADQRNGNDIGVRVEGVEWPRRIGGHTPAALVGEAVGATLRRCGPARPVEIGVLLTDADAVRVLNRRFRGHDRPTNVLAFATGDDGTAAAGAAAGPLPLGDIVIAGAVCRDEAVAQGKRFADHVRHLAVHGTLHLLGHDHDAAGEAEIMEELERDILAGLGAPDPYDASAAA
jgi:probable rRNA maturation factor